MKLQSDKVNDVAEQLQRRLGDAPDVVVVMGSGLGDSEFAMEEERRLTFAEISGWPTSTVKGHAGFLRRGRVGTREVLLQAGRVHLYEGYCAEDVVLPVRAAIKWGARRFVITNAAGGINAYLKPGMILFIEDHINLTGVNPLVGVNDDTLGPRFPDMTEAYCRKMRAVAVEEASRLDIAFKIGVYAGMLGPSYETPAEVRMLAALGADAVGMSTVLEVIAATHGGAKVLGISTISNAAAQVGGQSLTHDDVTRLTGRASASITRLIEASLESL